jgi:hypothetical protein
MFSLIKSLIFNKSVFRTDGAAIVYPKVLKTLITTNTKYKAIPMKFKAPLIYGQNRLFLKHCEMAGNLWIDRLSACIFFSDFQRKNL